LRAGLLPIPFQIRQFYLDPLRTEARWLRQRRNQGRILYPINGYILLSILRAPLTIRRV